MNLQVHTSREEASLGDTKDDSESREGIPSVHEPHTHHYRSLRQCNTCEMDSWTEITDDDCRRKLEDDIRGEEDQRHDRVS